MQLGYTKSLATCSTWSRSKFGYSNSILDIYVCVFLIQFTFSRYIAMDFSSHKKSALQTLNQYSLYEKIFLVYTIILIILFVALPIVEKGSLQTTEIETYTIFNSNMVPFALLTSILLWSMLARNMSSKFKKAVYRTVGFRSTDSFIMFLGLLTITISLFGIHGITSLINNTFSQKIALASGAYIIVFYALFGMIMALVVSYKNATSWVQMEKEIPVTHEQDVSQTEAFKKVEQEFEGLFKS